MSVLFQEKQKFNQWWVWLIMLVSTAIGIGAGWSAYAESGDLIAMIVGGGVGILAAIMFALITLKTTITSEGIEIAFRPFSSRRIFRSEIKKAYVRKYSPIGEYGGWGYRIGSKGKAYNVSGEFGLQLELNSGESILVGTQHPEILEELMVDYLDEEATEDILELKALEKKKAERLSRK